MRSIHALLLISVFWLLAAACSTDPKFKQYYVEGERLYRTHCSNCHQKDGKGLGLVYPPLAQSDFLDSQQDQVLCLTKKGLTGEIIVNGKRYNQAMPGVPSLTELEIAEIATYIYNSWGQEKGIIEVTAVSRALRDCPVQ